CWAAPVSLVALLLPLPQQVSPFHVCVSVQLLRQVVPPQSTSVSRPFIEPSWHWSATQVWLRALQKPVWQSPAARHALVSPHLPQTVPPQSMSVSLVSLTPSSQAEAAQVWVMTLH